ncbi:MAG TPA: hypothetical protein VLU43_12085 [Anaeromyxobacteraceae bacterium]|nr:hypothetical protein [Anaeromyxobacteraceae bacterium]
MIRESVYLCSCRSGSTMREAYVRAWDEREAADVFVRELKDDGVRGAVDIRVRPLRAAPSIPAVAEAT